MFKKDGSWKKSFVGKGGVNYLCNPLKKKRKVLQKIAKISLFRIKKNFAEIKRPLTFATRLKKSGRRVTPKVL